MKKNFLNILQLAFFLGFGIFLVWWAVSGFSEEDKAEMMKAFKSANYIWLLISMVMAIASHLSRAMRWQQLITPIVGKKPSLANSFLSLMVGYIANLAFPRLGEVARCGVVTKYEGIAFEKAFGTVITERIIDLIMLLSATVLVILLQFDILGSFVYEQIIQPLSSKLMGGTSSLIILLVVAVVIAIAYFLLRNFRQTAIYQKIAGFAKGLWEGIQSIRTVENIPLFIGHTLFIWLMYFGMTYICVFTLSETSHLNPVHGLAILVIGGFMMVVTQGGLGAYPLGISKLLELYSIPATIGYAFGWIIWSAQTLLVLVVGVLSLAALPLFNQKKEEE